MVQDEPLASPVSAGEIVAGKYRVERVLGVGGMGVVVSARHTTLDQAVAIKFLVRSRFDSPEESIARFLAEARAAARIESDHVCRVFDVGTLETGVPFMVMEHLEGHDLDDDVSQRGQLPIGEAIDYVLQAADALAAAHALGIVHRDIKPANLFLARRPDGSHRVKVLDFGISKAGSDRSALAARSPRATTSLGSPAYMSPEQVRAAPDVDARADIWGLGAILYELVTGQMAFVGADIRSVLDMVLREDPCPMNALRRDTPPELEQIVMRCLERDRERRWPTAARLAKALSTFGTPGMFSQLASVQRELGSLASISGIRGPAALPSVEPMVASVGIATQPDPEEVRAREGIVDDWTKLRARKRTARTAVLAMSSITCIIGVAGILFWMATRATPVASTSTSPVPAAPEASGLPPPAATDLGGVAAPAPSPPPDGTGTAAASASASTAPEGSVHTAGKNMHPARAAPAKSGAAVKSGGKGTRPGDKGNVNHLLDTRD